MSDILERLADVVESRKGGDPEASYVSRLLAGGEDAILKAVMKYAADVPLGDDCSIFELTFTGPTA